MNFFEGYPFFLCLIPVLLAVLLLGVLEKPLRWYSLAVSCLMIWMICRSAPEQMVYLAIFFFWEYGIIRLYLGVRTRRGRRGTTYGLALAAALFPLVSGKIAGVWGISFFGFVGISYLTFKTVQMVIEIYDGVIREADFLEYAGFLLFFPTLSSGPIDRSRRFGEDWKRVIPRKEYLELAGEGIWKICLGLVYKVVLAAMCYKGMSFLEGILENGACWYQAAAYGYAYGFYLFFDFAGYSLMAVGTSYLLGIRTPDNFRKPFASVDLKDFWDRWHISLSHWFRDFLFSRFIMKCTRKKWFSTRLTRASVGFLVNMTVMGMWHGLTPSYLLYGVYHGALLAVTEIWQKKSAFYKKYKNHPMYRAASWLITMQAVMLGFLIFSGKFLELAGGLGNRVGIP